MKFFNWLNKYFEEVFMAILLSVIACSIMSQVIMRYVFNSALPWPEEISRYALVMFCFMTIGYCTINRTSLKIDTILVLLPLKLQACITIACNLGLIFLYGYLGYAGCLVTRDAFVNNNVTSALGIPLGYIYSAALLGLLVAIIRLVQVVAQDFRELSSGQIKEKQKTIEDVI